MHKTTWLPSTAKNVIIIPRAKLLPSLWDYLNRLSTTSALIALGLTKWDWRLVAALEALLLLPLWNWSFDGRW